MLAWISRKISLQFSFKNRFVVSPKSLLPLYKFRKSKISLFAEQKCAGQRTKCCESLGPCQNLRAWYNYCWCPYNNVERHSNTCLDTLKVILAFSMRTWTVLLRFTLLPSNVNLISGWAVYNMKRPKMQSTCLIIALRLTTIQFWMIHGHLVQFIPNVMLLRPMPWIGKTRTRW